ncbi:MAG: pilus assembly protein CpaE [Pseudomonadota bacterium]
MANAAKLISKLTGGDREEHAVQPTRSVTADDLGGLEDDAWFDEELSDEELAALGDEILDELDDDDELAALEELEGLDESELLPEGSDDHGLFGDDYGIEENPAHDYGSQSGTVRAAQQHGATPTAIPEELPMQDAYAHGGDAAITEPPLTEDELDYAPNEDVAPSQEPSLGGDMDELRALTVSGRSSATVSGPVEEEDEIESSETDHVPVPRISIHAFCESDETTALLERAAIDRRLSKTHLTMHMGGIGKAVDHFQTNVTPNLIILETLSGGSELLAKLGELAEVCDPSTKVIVIGCVNDIALYRELMRAGISEYIVNPYSPLQVIRAISTLYVDPDASPIGKTLAFVGARGGVGSSTIAHNVGWCTAENLESDTVILDLDLPFGTASLDFEQDPTSGLLESLSAPERLDGVLLDRLLQKHTERLSLFTAPNLLDRDYELADGAFETVIDVVRGVAPTIVIDVPHVWTNWSKRILQTADEIVITTTPDLAAFRNTKNLVDVVSSARPNDGAPKLVINQFDAKTSSVQPEQYAEHVGLEPSCIISWEPQLFHTAATNAAPVTEVGPKTKSAQNIQHLSEVLLGRAEFVSKKPSSFDFGKFFKRG